MGWVKYFLLLATSLSIHLGVACFGSRSQRSVQFPPNAKKARIIVFTYHPVADFGEGEFARNRINVPYIEIFPLGESPGRSTNLFARRFEPCPTEEYPPNPGTFRPYCSD